MHTHGHLPQNRRRDEMLPPAMEDKSICMTSDLIVERRGALAEITLNRPAALNALSDSMRDKIIASIPEFARDPDVYAVIIRASGSRAFCAGGDVRELVALAKRDIAAARKSFSREYRMNWMLECFSRPTVSLMNGIVMGSGAGLSLYNTHRVAGPDYAFAMPETAIGLFPDVGACAVLSKLPGNAGRYLGLTGRRINRCEAHRLGLVTHCVEADAFDHITTALEQAEPVDRLVDPLHRDPGADGALIEHKSLIEDLFSGATVEEIFAAIERVAAGSGAHAQWSQDLRDELGTRAPMSLKVTLRHLDACQVLGLRETLNADNRLAARFLAGQDFAEGVRAMLIDKDQMPKWHPQRLEDIRPADVSAYFLPLETGELELPSRSAMQASRI